MSNLACVDRGIWLQAAFVGISFPGRLVCGVSGSGEIAVDAVLSTPNRNVLFSAR